MTADLDKAIRAVHRADIDRYRRLLATHLSDHERQLVEEQEALDKAIPPGPSLDLARD